jgi:hypothetical protein
MNFRQTAQNLLTKGAFAAAAFFSPVAIATGVVAATAVTALAANAQIQQTTIKVDNADCTVTEMSTGRGPTHMVQLAGPQGAAMISVDRDNKIVAYLSPPGGGQYKALIDKVWAAYLDQKNGGAGAVPAATTAAGGPTPAAEPSDSSTALRDQANAILANAQARAAGGTGGGKLTVEFPANGGAVVSKGSRVMTLSPDGADVTIVDTSVTGQSRTEQASYEGDGTDKDYSLQCRYRQSRERHSAGRAFDVRRRKPGPGDQGSVETYQRERQDNNLIRGCQSFVRKT